MRSLLVAAALATVIGCGGGALDSDPGLDTERQPLALYNYFASDTDSAAVNTTNWPVHLGAGETVMIGTCGINESAFTDDTYLRLYDSEGVQQTYNDDACEGVGSKMSYTAATAGDYEVRAGCWSSHSCSGTVAVSRRKGTFSYTAANTYGATINTYNKQYYFSGGDVVSIGTCAAQVTGGTATAGDTFLRLYTLGGASELTANDDGGPGCGTSSHFKWEIPSSGYYQIKAGCKANTACTATVAVYIE